MCKIIFLRPIMRCHHCHKIITADQDLYLSCTDKKKKLGVYEVDLMDDMLGLEFYCDICKKVYSIENYDDIIMEREV